MNYYYGQQVRVVLILNLLSSSASNHWQVLVPDILVKNFSSVSKQLVNRSGYQKSVATRIVNKMGRDVKITPLGSLPGPRHIFQLSKIYFKDFVLLPLPLLLLLTTNY